MSLALLCSDVLASLNGLVYSGDSEKNQNFTNEVYSFYRKVQNVDIICRYHKKCPMFRHTFSYNINFK